MPAPALKVLSSSPLPTRTKFLSSSPPPTITTLAAAAPSLACQPHSIAISHPSCQQPPALLGSLSSPPPSSTVADVSLTVSHRCRLTTWMCAARRSPAHRLSSRSPSPRLVRKKQQRSLAFRLVSRHAPRIPSRRETVDGLDAQPSLGHRAHCVMLVVMTMTMTSVMAPQQDTGANVLCGGFRADRWCQPPPGPARQRRRTPAGAPASPLPPIFLPG